jgi:hypothetical protein
MPKYHVCLRRTTEQTLKMYIETSDPEEAFQVAMDEGTWDTRRSLLFNGEIYQIGPDGRDEPIPVYEL